ncbi:MAG: hypothetical protein ACO1SX_28185 [Actinomycetota bacterium]
MKVQQVPLRAALKQMLAGTSVKYLVDASVPDVPVNLNVRDVAPTAVLRLLVRRVREMKGAEALCLEGENGVYRLKLDPVKRARQRAEEEAVEVKQEPPVPVDAAFRDPRLAGKITQSFKKITLREVTDALFTATGCQYSFSGKVNELVVSLELKNVSRLEGLRQLAATAAKGQPGSGLWRDGDIYVIGPRYWKARPDQP